MREQGDPWDGSRVPWIQGHWESWEQSWLSLKEIQAKYLCKIAMKIIIYTSLAHMCHQVYLFQMKAVLYGLAICRAKYKKKSRVTTGTPKCGVALNTLQSTGESPELELPCQLCSLRLQTCKICSVSGNTGIVILTLSLVNHFRSSLTSPYSGGIIP